VLPGQDFFLTETVYLFESCCAEQGIDLLQAKITKAVLKRLLLFVRLLYQVRTYFQNKVRK